MTMISVSHFPTGQLLAPVVARDMAADPATTNVRSAATATRRMLFEVDGAEVVLQVRPGRSSGLLCLVGQVLDAGLPREAAGIELCGPAGEIASMTDDDGEFQVDALPTGDYSLTVGTADFLFHAPSLVLA